MNQEDHNTNSSFLHIKELKEKVRSLVSEVDLNRENAKFKHEKNFHNNLSDSVSGDENEDEFLDCTEIQSRDETNWLLEEDNKSESVKDICKRIYLDIDENRPDVTSICRQLELSSTNESNVFSNQRVSIDSRTFTRPKKYVSRPPLTSVLNTEERRPELQRRLTTTISPTPHLVTKLNELSKNNNRSVSANNENAKLEDGSEESLADFKKPLARAKRQSLPASLFDRLQELKRANSTFKITGIAEPSKLNGRVLNEGKSNMFEDAKKVTAALDIDLKNSNSSRLSEIFRNTQDYYSDDNESFISLDEVSGFCDRLTLSTDQSTYSSIVREMEQHEICLFHRSFNDERVNESRLTFGGMEIPGRDFPKIASTEQFAEDNDLNRTYEIDDEESVKKTNNTFEINKSVSKHNIMNATYDANKKPGLVDVILQSDVIKNLSPHDSLKKASENLCNNNNSNNNQTLTTFGENKMMNYTYDKHNGTLDQNQLNVLHTEKYSTKVFDSSFKKTQLEEIKSPRRSNGKKDSDHSEDDCMSTTSDNSYRSGDSSSETKTVEIKNATIQQKKKFSSTPIMNQAEKLDFDVVSPIRMEIGDGESHAYSNPSSRGISPKRMHATMQPEGMQKHRMPNLRQPLKVPQRELKLKPALIRPSQNFRRPLSYARTSSEPSVPQKVESFQPVASASILRPSGPTTVPSLTNLRPSSRASGIPRPPTRLKQPQISKMTKQISSKHIGPFGDVENNVDDVKKDRRKKETLKSEDGDKSSSKIKKDRRLSQERVSRHENNQKIYEHEKREQERREKYEREVAEAERNEREMEFERWEKERSRSRLKNSGSLSRYKPRKPPAGYKDPHEVCKQVLPTKVKEKKRQEIKALMNCIAFTPSQIDLTGTSEENQVVAKERKETVEEMDNSSSSDTTSDITDVTPRSSSSGCSSMSKQSTCLDKAENSKVDGASVKKVKEENKLKLEKEINSKKSNSKNSVEEKKKDNQTGEHEVRNLTEVELEEMKYLQDAFEDLDLDEETSDFASSIISGLSEERRAKCNRKNMTFTNEQLREIERVNLILLKKIMNHRKPRVKPQRQAQVNRKTSAAINRSRMEEKIERENKILLKKLQSAKGTTGTLSRKNSQSACY